MNKKTDSIKQPIMKGELEVTLKDLNGNVLHTDKGHNTVINENVRKQFMNMFLAINNNESFDKVYAEVGSDNSFTFNESSSDENVEIKNTVGVEGVISTVDDNIIPSPENSSLISNYSQKYTIGNETGNINANTLACYFSKISPVKMLFGTGFQSLIREGETFTGANLNTNYYPLEKSDNKYYSYKTILDTDTEAEVPTTLMDGSDYYIPGAVKFITADTDEGDTKYQYGRPCFVYLQATDINIDINNPNSIVFKAVIPANDKGNPYNDIVLRDAGMYCDNRQKYYNDTSEQIDSFVKTEVGTLMFKKAIQPIKKTSETQLEFKWTVTFNS